LRHLVAEQERGAGLHLASTGGDPERSGSSLLKIQR
jgi:hypothetical protein